MTTAERPKLKVIGTRPIRHDGPDKVTGRAIYGADFKLPGMLYGKILRSPHAHAAIRSIDVSAALAHPGVRAVVTGQDLPLAASLDEALWGNVGTNLATNVLARDKALYRGHAVAAVAATTLQAAEEAAKLIVVDYDVLPPVMTARDAMRPEAPILHADLRTRSLGADRKTNDTGVATNIGTHHQVIRGDVEAGFRAADIVIEREFETATVHQGYIELHNATALWGPDDAITIWCSSQGTFNIRSQLALILKHPVSKIKVIPLEIGGGFGGKIQVYLEPVAALLSKRTGRPVKIMMTRTEDFEGTGPTSGGHSKVKVGATSDGWITAAEMTIAYEAGAFPGAPVAAGMDTFSHYKVENVLINGYDVVVNKPRVAPYRAPGAPQAAFATEQVMDELAEKLGLDPIELRLRNAAREGDRRIDGVRYGPIVYAETLQATLDHPHYSAPLEGPNRGRGVATGSWHTGGGQSSCFLSVQPDGSVTLIEGSVDIGGSRPVAAMQAAEVLGIPAEDVHPTVVDTDSIGFTGLTAGSSTAFKLGWSVPAAAQDVIRQMSQRAATIWEVDVASVTYVDGVFQSTADPEKHMTFKELAGRLNATGGPISAQATLAARGGGDAFSTHIVDVEVDPETGKVQILRYTAIQDVGRAIHPSYVEGQIQGGVAQGIGWALHEGYFFNDNGQMANSSFLDYRMPTSLDLPMIDTVLIETDGPNHPFGAKGVGELPIVPPMAAIAIAIARATGVRLNKLPMSPGRVLEALWEQKSMGA